MVHTISLIAVVSYFPVVDDGDGVLPPADHHGAHPGPGSLLRIKLQDVVQGVYFIDTNC